MGKNELNLYSPISWKNEKIRKEACSTYKVNKIIADLKEPVKFEDITKCINLISIIKKFDKEEIKKYVINSIIINNKNFKKDKDEINSFYI